MIYVNTYTHTVIWIFVLVPIYLELSKVFDTFFHRFSQKSREHMAWTGALLAELKSDWMVRPKRW